MTLRRYITALAVASTLVVGSACSHSSSHGGASGSTACDDYFDAIVGIACSDTTPPPDEVSRIRSVFEDRCARWQALPGSGITASSLDACAAAVASLGCGPGYLAIPECSFQGSLPDGSSCNDASQCQSGVCPIPIETPRDGGASPPPCGTCASTIAAGQPCATGDICALGTLCAPSGGGFACTPITYGDVGATCDGLAADCRTGLTCDLAMQQCAAPGEEGAPCVSSAACAASLSCFTGPDGTSACRSPAAEGGPCADDADCAQGLGCAVPGFECAPITWASPGDSCGGVVHCVVGLCPIGAASMDGSPVTGGTCPAVLEDGAPCFPADPAHTCDTFSTCTNGACQQPYSVTCP